jgi:hypothetical protein
MGRSAHSPCRLGVLPAGLGLGFRFHGGSGGGSGPALMQRKALVRCALAVTCGRELRGVLGAAPLVLGRAALALARPVHVLALELCALALPMRALGLHPHTLVHVGTPRAAKQNIVVVVRGACKRTAAVRPTGVAEEPEHTRGHPATARPATSPGEDAEQSGELMIRHGDSNGR